MADYINNVAATDRYTDALTLGPTYTATRITCTVANNPCLMQFAVGREGNWRWTDEREFLVPASASVGQSFTVDRVIGVRFRNANPGQAARILCILSGPDDPDFSSGQALLGALTAGGGITPTLSAVQIEHNDVLVDTEPTVDLEDGDVVWTVVADGPNARVKVSAIISDPTLTGSQAGPVPRLRFTNTVAAKTFEIWLNNAGVAQLDFLGILASIVAIDSAGFVAVNGLPVMRTTHASPTPHMESGGAVLDAVTANATISYTVAFALGGNPVCTIVDGGAGSQAHLTATSTTSCTIHGNVNGALVIFEVSGI